MALAGLFSSLRGSKPNANQPILLLISSLFFIIITTTTTEAQVVSYGMRKLALSMNQFGLDMLRTIDRMDRVLNATTSQKTTPGSFGFCPFCVGSSLAMILAGLKDDGEGLKQGEGQPNIFTTYQHRRASAFESLRHALYLGQMQPQEIHLAFYDLAAHLQLNLPEGFRAKRQAEPAPPEPEKTVSAEIEDMEESIEDSVEHDDDLADDEEDDEEVQLPEWPKFKRSISDSEEEGAEFRTSEASVSSEFAMSEPGDLAEGEFRQSGGSGLFPSLTETASSSSSVEMNLLSQVYIQRYLPVDYHYYVLLQYYYKTPIRSLDFAYAPEESRAHINAVVQHLSKEKIREIVGGEGSGSAQKELDSTRLLLLSGLTLQGKLDFRDQVKRRGRRGLTPFSGVRNRVQQNSKRPMVMLLGGSSKVQPALLSPSTPLPPSSSTPPPSTPSSSSTPANHHTSTSFNPFKPFGPNASRTKESIRLRYSFSSYLNATILEMPFTGGIISFVALVPLNSGSKRNGENNAMATLLSRLNAQLVVDLVQHLEIRRIDVTMPILKLTHSIAHWNILLSQMGLSALFDPLSAEEADEEGGGDNGAVSSSQSFAGMSAFPLASVTQLQHQTVIEVGIEDSSSPYTSGLENSLQNPSTASAGQGGYTKPLQMVVPRPKMRPPKRSLGLNSTRIVRVAKRSSNLEATEVVQSVVMKVLEQRPQLPHQQRREPLMSGQSKPISVLKNNSAAAAGLASAKRPHVNLEEEEFIYLVLDNISGLVLAMGKHRPERL